MDHDSRVCLLIAILLLPFLFVHLALFYKETSQNYLQQIARDDPSAGFEIVNEYSIGRKVNSENSEHWSSVSAWAYRQTIRKKLVQRGCRLITGKKTTPRELYVTKDSKRHLDHILVDDTHKALYCYVPKVACTNWKRLWMLLTGRSNASSPLDIPSAVPHQLGAVKRLSDMHNIQSIQTRLNSYKKFLFVRDPLERLVSAYRNKLENDPPPAFREVAEEILRRHRKVPNRSSSGGVTFSEFIRFLVTKKMLKREELNEHWATFSDLCHPCIVSYDFIGKYETLHEDAKNILREIGAPKDLEFPPFTPSITATLTSRYLDTLFPSEQRSLYSLFRADFVIFNYRIPKVKNTTILKITQ